MARPDTETTTATSFDLFGTLVAVDTTADPAAAVAAELEERGVSVPPDWARAYRRVQIDAPRGAEVPLPVHVRAILDRPDETGRRSGSVRDRDRDGDAIDRAVAAAFDPDARTREGAVEAVAAAADRGPVGVLSNCSVPGLVERTIAGSAIDRDRFDAVVSSATCGWRKPHEHTFEAIARRLGVAPSALVHVGDDPRTDGGAATTGATAVTTDETPLPALPALLEGLE